MGYDKRTYRNNFFADDMEYFNIKVKDTDLCIGICKKDYSNNLIQLTEKMVGKIRNELETYIEIDNDFKSTLLPYEIKKTAPSIAKIMAKAAYKAKVGPMAAVAGAFSEYIGKELSKISSEIIVENGGDIYICTTKKRNIGIFAGKSPFSDCIGIEIKPELSPIGICTSSGVVGPSLSFGKADAAIVLSQNTALADAAATALGNEIHSSDDVQKGVDIISKIPGLLGALAINDDKMAVWGQMKLVPLELD